MKIPMMAWMLAVVVGWISLAPRAHAKNWSVTATGEVVVAEGATFAPVAGARVKLIDQDDAFDKEMGQGVTDANGRFEIIGVGGDPLIPLVSDETSSKPDVYVRVELVASSVVVQNELDYVVRISTSVRSNTAGEIDFGTISFGPVGPVIPARLFVRAQPQANLYASTIGGTLPFKEGRLRIVYPSLTIERPFTDTAAVYWPPGYEDVDRLYRCFGERLRYAVDFEGGPLTFHDFIARLRRSAVPGQYAHFLADVQEYGYTADVADDAVSNEGYAFNFGWALYFASQLDERVAQTLEAWTDRPGGTAVVGNVAARLFRLSKTSGGVRVLWRALRSASIHRPSEFEDALRRQVRFRVFSPGPG